MMACEPRSLLNIRDIVPICFRVMYLSDMTDLTRRRDIVVSELYIHLTGDHAIEERSVQRWVDQLAFVQRQIEDTMVWSPAPGRSGMYTGPPALHSMEVFWHDDPFDQLNTDVNEMSDIPVTLSARALESFPCGDADFHGIDGEDNCNICISELGQDEDVRRLPCGHYFHSNCIDDYLLEVNVRCPSCRHDARTENDRNTVGT